MFVTDTDGTPFKPTGEIALFDPQGQNPKTFLGGLAAPNGISFTPGLLERLWVSEYQAQRELLLTPSKDHQSLAEAQVGMHGSPGIGHFDSNTGRLGGQHLPVRQRRRRDPRLERTRANCRRR